MHKTAHLFLILMLVTLFGQIAAFRNNIRNQMPIEPELEKLLPNQRPKQQ
jgi:hypothetical protein